MISVAEARAHILAAITTLRFERVALADALGRSLAEPIIAPRLQPPFAASSMDGYAVRSADTPGRLRVVGESAAGAPYASALQRGEAVRIFTGAPMPEGADAVVIQEEAPRTGDAIEAPLAKAGQYVRAAGLDFAAGAALLPSGRILDGVAIATAVAADCADLSVVRRPRIAILIGGDEIVPPGAPRGPFQIRDSASSGLAGLASAWGAAPLIAASLPDDAGAIARAAETALVQSDLVLMVGGASVGDRDLAREAFESIGASIVFSKVAVRPGKPTWFALRNGKPILGLAGNPASAFVCARLFLRPALEKMLGRDPTVCIATRAARLQHAVEANSLREHWARGVSSVDKNGQLWVNCTADQDSSLLSVFVASDCLVLRTPNASALAAGALVQTLPF